MKRLKRKVYEALMELPKNDLVRGTSGNVSGREENYVVIKPSGVSYEYLSPRNLVVVNMEGEVVEGRFKPSVDTKAHLHIYDRSEDIRGIVHTHSTFATAFAALGKSIPVYLTELADLFGDSIPISDYVPPGTEEIGNEFEEKTGQGRVRGIVMRNHGVFTGGETVTSAVKAAIRIEHSAKISYFAELLGSPESLPEDEVDRLHERYISEYGQ